MAISMMQEYKTGLTQLAPSLYTYLQYNGGWGMSNSGFLVGNKDVVVFDSLFYASLQRPFMQALKNTTPKPVSSLINTHSHGDHTNGNEFFTGSAIVSHVKCLEEMRAQAAAAAAREANPNAPRPPRPAWMTEQMQREIAQVKRTYPTATFNDQMTIYHDDVEIRLFHYGPAHTTGDLVIFLPKYEVAFVGDLGFFYCTPIANGSVTNFITTLDMIMRLNAAQFVSGHGPVGGIEALREEREYLEFVVDEAKKGIKAGLSWEEAAKKTNLGAFAKWGESDRFANNLRSAYRDLGALT